MSLARIVALFHAQQLRFDARRAARREAEALRRAGRDLADHPLAAADARLQPLFAALRPHRSRLDRLSAALATSLEAEPADYDSVVPWLRPLVVLRGLCDRAVLQHQLHRCRRELDLCYEALGRAALASPTERLRPFDGEPRPPWVRVLADEGRALGAACWRQLHSRFAPRVSALAGLATGWWVASRYTDSHLRSVVNSLGISRGGTHVVSSTTYKAMSFWLPILAAAMCAYLGDRLARAIRHRHESGTSDSAVQNP